MSNSPVKFVWVAGLRGPEPQLLFENCPPPRNVLASYILGKGVDVSLDEAIRAFPAPVAESAS